MKVFFDGHVEWIKGADLYQQTQNRWDNLHF